MANPSDLPRAIGEVFRLLERLEDAYGADVTEVTMVMFLSLARFWMKRVEGDRSDFLDALDHYVTQGRWEAMEEDVKKSSEPST